MGKLNFSNPFFCDTSLVFEKKEVFGLNFKFKVSATAKIFCKAVYRPKSSRMNKYYDLFCSFTINVLKTKQKSVVQNKIQSKIGLQFFCVIATLY